MHKSKLHRREDGFTYIDTLIAITMLTIGILGSLSAITYAVLFTYTADAKTRAKEITQSTLETVFAVRDLQDQGAISTWDRIQVKETNNNGIFVKDWTPIRTDPGADGIYGTADDACAGSGACTANGATNNSPLVKNMQRKIEITNIPEGNVVRKRIILVTVRYFVGRLVFDETAQTIIADFPFTTK